jgi:hypothetical protein
MARNPAIRCWLLAVVCGLFASPTSISALEIKRFYQLSLADQSRYLVVLFEGTRDYLKRQGRPDLAKEVYRMFDETPHGDTMPPGMRQFGKDLISAEQYQQKTGKTMHVEYALILTLKKKGVEIPKAEMMTFGQHFKPAGTN